MCYYCIYKITINDEFYIGSTKNLNQRYYDHLDRAKNEKYKHILLYQKIRENNNIFDIEILKWKELDKKNVFELEQEYIKNLQPQLNSFKAYQTIEEKREKNKLRMREVSLNDTPEEKERKRLMARKTYQKNKDKILAKAKVKVKCEICNKFVSRLNDHKKTIKHKKNMLSINI